MTPPSNAFVADFLHALIYLIPILLGIGVAWKALTKKRDVTEIAGQPIDVNVTDPIVRRSEFRRIEAEITELRQQMAASLELGETRSVQLHNRINDVVENTAEIKGRMEAFTQSFEAFNAVIAGCLGTNANNHRRNS